MTEWDERACIEAAKDDPGLFGDLYERYVDRIYNYVYRRVGNVHDAEDLTSRTFYRALSHFPTYRDMGFPFSSWLYRIAHNLIANWHRDRSRKPVIALDELVAGSLPREQPELMTALRDDTRMLQEVIRKIDPARQELLVLKFTEGLSNAEIGTVMGRSEGAIKSLYHRTLLQIRKGLSERGLEIE